MSKLNIWLDQNNIHNSSKGITDIIFQTKFVGEEYLNALHRKFINILVKLKTGNHCLPIEAGR